MKTCSNLATILILNVPVKQTANRYITHSISDDFRYSDFLHDNDNDVFGPDPENNTDKTFDFHPDFNYYNTHDFHKLIQKFPTTQKKYFFYPT